METGEAVPHPESIIRCTDGRVLLLKVHRALWSGALPENSLPAIEECFRERVARTEIDLHMLQDHNFLVLHDPYLDLATNGTGLVADLPEQQTSPLRLRFRGRMSNARPPLFSEVVELIAAQRYPTQVELDIPGTLPLPWARVEELARLVEPVKDRVVFNGADWNMRRLAVVDPSLPFSYDPGAYLDWVPEGDPEELESGLPRGAYGYLDAHPLARSRMSTVADYIADRLGGIARLVPGAREAHVRLDLFEHLLDDGVAQAAEIVHGHGMQVDVWTLNADTPGWRTRLQRLIDAGVDMITTDTPRALSAAGSRYHSAPAKE